MDRDAFTAAYRDVNKRFLKLIEDISALQALSDVDIRGGDEADILRGALRAALDNLDLDRGAIYRIEGPALHKRAELGWDPTGDADTTLLPTQVVMGEGVIGRATAQAAGESERVPAADERLLLAVPLRCAEQTLGVFVAVYARGEPLDPEERRTVQLFCRFLAQLLLSANLLSRMDQLVVERTRYLEDALDDAQALRVRYEELSVVDELTRLHNRRYFFPEARAALARTLRAQTPLSLLIVDADRFKQVNDRFGHATGDTVLRDMAQLLREQAREGDIVARFGGEEFVLALPGTDEAGARSLAERIRAAAKSLEWAWDGQRLSITLSVGVASLVPGQETDAGTALERLLHEADAALYYAKEHGRDQVRLHTELGRSG